MIPAFKMRGLRSVDRGIAAGTGFSGEFWFDASTPPYFTASTAEGGFQYAYRSGGLMLTMGGLTLATTTPAEITIKDNYFSTSDSLGVQALGPIAVTGTGFGASPRSSH